jgi:hypothetical protein
MVDGMVGRTVAAKVLKKAALWVDVKAVERAEQ